jgi:hypothetical protein
VEEMLILRMDKKNLRTKQFDFHCNIVMDVLPRVSAIIMNYMNYECSVSKYKTTKNLILKRSRLPYRDNFLVKL